MIPSVRAPLRVLVDDLLVVSRRNGRPPRAVASTVFSSTILSKIRGASATIDRIIFMTWSLVETAYARLPDWAQPIVWALGLSAPAAIVAVGIWTVMQL